MNVVRMERVIANTEQNNMYRGLPYVTEQTLMNCSMSAREGENMLAYTHELV